MSEHDFKLNVDGLIERLLEGKLLYSFRTFYLQVTKIWAGGSFPAWEWKFIPEHWINNLMQLFEHKLNSVQRTVRNQNPRKLTRKWTIEKTIHVFRRVYTNYVRFYSGTKHTKPSRATNAAKWNERYTLNWIKKKNPISYCSMLICSCTSCCSNYRTINSSSFLLHFSFYFIISSFFFILFCTHCI